MKNNKSQVKSLAQVTKKMLLSQYFILIFIVVMFLVFAPFLPVLTKWANISDIFSNVWPLLAVAMGQTIVFIIAGIDLSQTSIMAVCSVIGASIMTQRLDPAVLDKSPLWGWLINESGGPFSNNNIAIIVGITSMLLVGILIGTLNGLFISKLKMPAFMVTLVTQLFFGAIAIFLTQSNNITNLAESFIKISDDSRSVLSYPLAITVALGVFLQIILSKTVIGRWFYSIGANMKTSEVSGIPVQKVTILAYVISGFCAAVAAILYTSRLHMGRPTLGSNMLMDIVGATIIGGTSMYGGKGKMFWTFFGVIFFVLLSNILNLLNLSFFVINIVKGGFIIVAALFDVTRIRILNKEGA